MMDRPFVRGADDTSQMYPPHPFRTKPLAGDYRLSACTHRLSPILSPCHPPILVLLFSSLRIRFGIFYLERSTSGLDDFSRPVTNLCSSVDFPNRSIHGKVNRFCNAQLKYVIEYRNRKSKLNKSQFNF